MNKGSLVEQILWAIQQVLFNVKRCLIEPTIDLHLVFEYYSTDKKTAIAKKKKNQTMSLGFWFTEMRKENDIRTCVAWIRE